MKSLITLLVLAGCASRPTPPDAPPPDPAELRSQTPQPSEDWHARDVAIPTTDDLTLAGSVYLPAGDGPFPAVLLLADSGPNDRTGNVAAHRPLSVWARQLASHGVASLAFDDRGVGGSGGNLRDATLAQLSADATQALALLGSQPEVDGARLGVIGHGQGGIIAANAAATDTDLGLLVLLNTPGETGKEVLLDQAEALLVASGAPPMRAATHRRAHNDALDTLQAQPEEVRSAFKKLISIQVSIAEEHLGAERPVDIMVVVDAAVSTVTQPLFQSLLDHDPTTDLTRVRAPVLAIGGELDLQVLSGPNLDALRSALDGHPDATVLAFPGLNHLLQPAERGTPSEYGVIDTTVDPAVLEQVSTWVTQRFEG